MVPRRVLCDSCGAPVIWEFGCFDEADYDNGVMHRHHCAPLKLPTPMNEREWATFIADPDARVLLGLDPLRATRPAPRPPVEREPDKPRPPRRREGHVGGINV